MTVAPTVPKAVIKPKPVAKIIAKTKRSSREGSPDIIDIEKHEIEKNHDLSMSPNNSSTFSPNGSLKKKSMSQSDHIYDKPGIVGSPKSPSHFNVPNVSMSQSVPNGPSNVLYISTQQDLTVQPQNSPKSRKVPPPPPPKRTNSISGRQEVNMSQFAGSIPKSALQHTYLNIQKNGSPSHNSTAVTSESVYASVNSPKHTQAKSQLDEEMAPKQQAFASCVQSLSEKFGSKRLEAGNEETLSSDGEDFPPPPPPIAMDIITPKIHNYGIPSKNDKVGSDYRLKPKTEQSSHNNINSHSSLFDVKLKKTPVSEVSQKNLSLSPSPVIQGKPHVTSSPVANSHVTSSPVVQSKSHVTAQYSHSKSDSVINGKTSAANSSPSVKQTVENVEIRRKDSTTSFDSAVSTSSVDSNTLPFANENVGTIKQRTPTTKPSIVPISENVEPRDKVCQMENKPKIVKPTVPHKPVPSHQVIKGKNNIILFPRDIL